MQVLWCPVTLLVYALQCNLGLVNSTLDILFCMQLNANIVSGGKLPNVRHFDSKAVVEEYIRSIGIPAVFLDPGCFMTNLKTLMLSKVRTNDYIQTHAFTKSPGERRVHYETSTTRNNRNSNDRRCE